MTHTRMRYLPALWLASYVASACGGATPAAPPATAAAAAEPAEPAAVEAETEPDASGGPGWADMNVSRLVALVREQANARIAQVEPTLQIASLGEWVADPTAAPALGDRVCEQLLHLAVAAAAADEDAYAEGLVRLVRAKARNRNRAFVGNTLLSELARRRAGENEQAAVEAVFNELPAHRFGSSTVVFQLFQNAAQVEARMAQLRQQMISLDTASSWLFFERVLGPIVKHRDVYMAALAAVQQAHQAQTPPAPQPFSTVDLSRDRRAQNVVVAVWDTGVNPALFESQLFVNEAETLNGEDDDGNGLVDDRHGLIDDPTPGQRDHFFRPSEAVIQGYAPFLKGIMDLRAGMSATPAAQRVLALMAQTQDREAVEELERHLDAVGEWGHGTHVAGIMLAGVPQAKLAIFRSAWAGEARLYHHRGPTDEELAAERRNVEAIAQFIGIHQVRVVNASIGFSRDYVEGQLRHESERYQSDEAVRARAEEIHARRKDNWSYVFDQCPNTLFVVAAGNANRDVIEYSDVPASLERPNVLVVGAVDQQRNWATFTNSNPERVRVFDYGVAVESLIPNGERLALSGTSMASPNAANLAAKLFALAPRLSPSDVIAIIEATGEEIEAPFYGRIPHEARAVARARRAGRRR